MNTNTNTNTNITIMEPGNDYPVENLLNYRMIRRQKGFMRSSLLKVLFTCTMGCALVYCAQAWKPLEEPWRIDKALKSTEKHILRPLTHDPKAVGKLVVVAVVSYAFPPAAGGAISWGGVMAVGGTSAAYDGLVYHANERQMLHSFATAAGGALITAVSPNFPGNAYARGVQIGMANIAVRIGADYAFYGMTDMQGRALSASMVSAFVPDMGNDWTATFAHGAAKSFVEEAIQNEFNLRKLKWNYVVTGGAFATRNAFITQYIEDITKSFIDKSENKTGLSDDRFVSNQNPDLDKNLEFPVDCSTDICFMLYQIPDFDSFSQGNFDFGHDVISVYDIIRNGVVTAASVIEELSFMDSLAGGAAASAPISVVEGLMTSNETGSAAKGLAKTVCGISGSIVGGAAGTLTGGAVLATTKNPVAAKSAAIGAGTIASTATSKFCYSTAETYINASNNESICRDSYISAGMNDPKELQKLCSPWNSSQNKEAPIIEPSLPIKEF